MTGATREVRLPALSATMEEATLLTWLVTVGDEVREGEAIAEVSTDKVDMELESPYSGTVTSLTVDEGAAVDLGQVLATIATESDDLLGGLSFGEGETPAPEEPPAAPAAPGDAPTPPRDIVAASPPARRLARRLGIELSDVPPTGNRGQVTPTDVQGFADRRSEPPRSEPTPPPAPVPQGVDDAKRRAVRKATAGIMERSATIPQFTLYRQLRLEGADSERGGRGWTTEMVRAMALALREHPEMNARWDSETAATVPGEGAVIGVAVDRPGVGLVVAAIADPDQGDPASVDQDVRSLVARARAGKLRPADMVQPHITLSNLGGIGVDRFNALLFPPQAAIMSVGAIRLRPVATADGGLKADLTCEAGLTVDHRVADGADGARYLDAFAALVERQR